MKSSSRLSIFFYALTLSLLIAAFASTPAVAQDTGTISITQCGTVISQHGHYILANDLVCGIPPCGSGSCAVTRLSPVTPTSDTLATATAPMITPRPPSSPDGIDIVADHVDLMLNGHTITGDLSGNAVGISVGLNLSGGGAAPGNSHINIVGPGTITGFNVGVGFANVSHSSVKDVTFTNDFAGVLLIDGGCTLPCPSTKNNVQGNSADLTEFGFIVIAANDNTLRDNDASNSGAGIVVDGVNNDVRQNNSSGNLIGIVAGFLFAGATDNDITHNTALNNAQIDLADANGNCTANTWKHNTFVTADPPCIQ
jgi:parallel beta-helix repeat protein